MVLQWWHFLHHKGTNHCKTNMEIQVEGVVSPSGTTNACCTSKIHLSCTHRPTEIKPQSRDWELLLVSSLQLIRTAPNKTRANARKRWGWLQSGKGWGQVAAGKEELLKDVSRSQKEASLRYLGGLSNNHSTWILAEKKKKYLINWNLIAAQDQSGFPSHIQIS